LLPQLRSPRPIDSARVVAGLRRMFAGYWLKLVLADRLGLYVDYVFAHIKDSNASQLLLASYFFSFQIYGDFAGYSLIAIGAAQVLGFDLMENFRRPYLASSIREFWHRWHISLSTWFRDYSTFRWAATAKARSGSA